MPASQAEFELGREIVMEKNEIPRVLRDGLIWSVDPTTGTFGAVRRQQPSPFYTSEDCTGTPYFASADFGDGGSAQLYDNEVILYENMRLTHHFDGYQLVKNLRPTTWSSLPTGFTFVKTVEAQNSWDQIRSWQFTVTTGSGNSWACVPLRGPSAPGWVNNDFWTSWKLSTLRTFVQVDQPNAVGELQWLN
jgi:hypothetical protein